MITFVCENKSMHRLLQVYVQIAKSAECDISTEESLLFYSTEM